MQLGNIRKKILLSDGASLSKESILNLYMYQYKSAFIKEATQKNNQSIAEANKNHMQDLPMVNSQEVQIRASELYKKLNSLSKSEC